MKPTTIEDDIKRNLYWLEPPHNLPVTPAEQYDNDGDPQSVLWDMEGLDLPDSQLLLWDWWHNPLRSFATAAYVARLGVGTFAARLGIDPCLSDLDRLLVGL